MKIKFFELYCPPVLSLGMKCGFIMLNLKQKLSQKQQKLAGSPPPKKFKLSPSTDKVMLVVFLGDSHGIILAHFMPKGRTVIAGYYPEVMEKNLKN